MFRVGSSSSAGFMNAMFQHPSSNAPIYNESLTLRRNVLLFAKYVVTVFHLLVIFIWA